MPTETIKRKQLWQSLGNTKMKDWIKACEILDLRLTAPTKGSSHIAVRCPKQPDDFSLKSLIFTIYDHMQKDVHQKCFKAFLKYGFTEDDIWRALGKLN